MSIGYRIELPGQVALLIPQVLIARLPAIPLNSPSWHRAQRRRRATHRRRIHGARLKGVRPPLASLLALQQHHSRPLYKELRMGGKRGWGRGGGNGYASSSWNDKQGKWAYWKGTWSPRHRAEEERYDQVQLRMEASEQDPRDAGGGKTAFLLAVQKAVTLARRHDVKLRKLTEEQDSRRKLWKQYVEDIKRKFAKQKREFEADIQKLEADKISTLEAGQMAAAQVKAIIVGQSRPPQAAPPLDPNEAWATLWQEPSSAPSGATFLDDAMTAAAMCGMDLDFPSWEEGMQHSGFADEGPDRGMGSHPVRETAAAAPPGLSAPSYATASPESRGPRPAPYLPTSPTPHGPPEHPGAEMMERRHLRRHPGQRDPSASRIPTHVEAPRPGVKSATMNPPGRPAAPHAIQERLEAKRAAETPTALRPFRVPLGKGSGEPPPPAAAEETTAEEARRVPILEAEEAEEVPDFE